MAEPQWSLTPLKEKELNTLFAALLSDSSSVFGIPPSAAQLSADFFAELWVKNAAGIIKQISMMLPEDTPESELKDALLRRIAVEMAKLSLHFKRTKGQFTIMQSASMFSYLLKSMGQLQLINLNGPAAKADVPELQAQAAALRAALDVSAVQQSIEQGVLPGLSMADLENLKNYQVKKGGFLTGKVTLAFVAAAILLALFAF